MTNKGARHSRFHENKRENVNAWHPVLLIAGATFLAFLPALGNSLVDWDDLNQLVRNSAYRSGLWDAVHFAFTTGMSGHYMPLTWLSFSLDYAIGGDGALMFHLTNVILHALNAVLLFYIAKRLGLKELGATFAALLFGLHPLRVESVAWAAERKDVLSGFFYLLSVLYYLREERGKSVGFFVAALLSKISAITLPAALLILDSYPLRRKPDWRGKLPYALAAIVPVAANVVSEAYNSAFPGLSSFGALPRALSTCYGLVFYPWKTLWPAHLAPLYPYPAVFDPREPRFLLSAAAVALAAPAAWALRRRSPAAVAALAFYAVTLSPMAGFIRSWPQIAADRYSYLPCLGLAVLAGAGLSLALERTRARWPAFAAGGICLLLAALTWGQCLVWKDTESLWRYELRLQPQSAVAHYNLGSLFLNRREPVAAEQEFRRALDIDPAYAYAWNNLGNALCAQRRWPEGLDAYRRATLTLPGYWEAQNNLGLALESQGRRTEAEAAFKAAIVSRSDKSGPHENLALLYMSEGNIDQARQELAAASGLSRDRSRSAQLQQLLQFAAVQRARDAQRREPRPQRP